MPDSLAREKQEKKNNNTLEEREGRRSTPKASLFRRTEGLEGWLCSHEPLYVILIETPISRL